MAFFHVAAPAVWSYPPCQTTVGCGNFILEWLPISTSKAMHLYHFILFDIDHKYVLE